MSVSYSVKNKSAADKMSWMMHTVPTSTAFPAATQHQNKQKSNIWAKDSSCNFPTQGRFLAHGSSFFLSSVLFISWQQHLDVRPLAESSTGQQNSMGLLTQPGMSYEQQIWQKHWGEYCSCKWLAQVKGNGVCTSFVFAFRCLVPLQIFFYPPTCWTVIRH